MIFIKSNNRQEEQEFRSQDEGNESGLNQDLNFTYKISGFTIGTWIIYIAIVAILSVGYIFIINYEIAKLIFPPGVDVEFQIDEMLWGLFVPNLAVIIIAPIIWDIMCDLILSNGWMKSFPNDKMIGEGKKVKKQVKDVNLMPFKSVLGIKPKSNRHYYLEAKSVDLDMRDFGPVFKGKILGAISGSIGLTFLIASVLNIVVTSDIMEEPLVPSDVLFLSIMIMQVVPLFISFLIPINWVLNDTALHYINKTGFVEDLGDNMSKGIFKRFIGVGGIILGISVCYDLAYNENATLFVNIWVTAVYFLLYFLLLNAGTLVLISLLYLRFFHEKKVNIMRIGFTNYLSLGETNVKSDIEVSDTEKISQISEIKEERNKMTPIIKLISVLILLSLIIYGEYYVLFVIGPFTI